MAFGIHRDPTTICCRCDGPIQQGVTVVSWAPRVPERKSHKECYYSADKKPPMRGIHGFLLDEHGKETVNGNGTGVPAGTYVAEPQPAAIPANPNDPMAVLANGIFPHIEHRLNAHVTEEKVRGLVADGITQTMNDKLSETIEKLRGEFVHKVVLSDPATGATKPIPGLVHELFDKIRKILLLGENVFLYGDSGGGKTHLAMQIAESMELPMYSAELGKMTMPSTLVGYTDVQGKFVETDFYKWFTNGGLFLFDEYANANDNLRTILNSALDNGVCSFPGVGRTKKHEKAFCIAADNTCGLGANAVYTSREVMDASQRDRFVFVKFEYDTKLERALARGYYENADKWVDWIQSVRNTVRTLNLRLVVTPRCSIRGAKMLQAGGFKPDDIADMVVFRGVDADTRTKVLASSPIPARL